MKAMNGLEVLFCSLGELASWRDGQGVRQSYSITEGLFYKDQGGLLLSREEGRGEAGTRPCSGGFR